MTDGRPDPDHGYQDRREAAAEEDSVRFGRVYAEMKRRAAAISSRERLMAPHVTGSETSWEAAKRTVSFRAKQRDLVFTAYWRAGARGLTDPECQEACGLKGSSQRPRRVRLGERKPDDPPVALRLGVVVPLEGVTRDGCQVYVLREFAPDEDDPQAGLFEGREHISDRGAA